MTKIIISNLYILGAELFVDSESYLHELTDTEIDSTKGGISVATSVGTTSLVTLTFNF